MHIAALFDMDGLLIDSEASIMAAWRRAAGEMGINLRTEDYVKIVGRPAPDGIALLTSLFGGKQRLSLAHARVVADLDAIPSDLRFPLKPGVQEVLVELSELGVPCAVASSSRREEIEARLSAVRVRPFFAALAGGDEVEKGKPDPAVYLLAANRIGVDPRLCIAFEDSVNGAHAALAAGAKLVLVPDLVQPEDDIRKKALMVIRSLSEAKPQLKTWFRPSGETSNHSIEGMSSRLRRLATPHVKR